MPSMPDVGSGRSWRFLFRIRRLRDGLRYSTRVAWCHRHWNRDGKFLTLRALSQVPSGVRDNAGNVIEVWEARQAAVALSYADAKKGWGR